MVQNLRNGSWNINIETGKYFENNSKNFQKTNNEKM